MRRHPGACVPVPHRAVPRVRLYPKQVKAPTKTKMSNKEKKALAKLREARRARGEEVTDDEDD